MSIEKSQRYPTTKDVQCKEKKSLYGQFIGKVSPSNRPRCTEISQIENVGTAVHFLFKVSRQENVAVGKKRDKKKRSNKKRISSNWGSTYAILRSTFIFNGIDGWKKLGARVNKRRRWKGNSAL